jgi:hypothetical protein
MAGEDANRSGSIRDRLAEYGAELVRVREMLDLAFGKGARSSRAREDRVVFPLLVSCRDILEEILFAVNGGFGRVALRNARTMYECVVIARYLNVHPNKADDFLSAFRVQWAKIVQSIPSQYRSPAMDRELAAHVPKYAQGKPVGVGDLKWSGRDILAMAKEAGQLASLHPLAFDYGSAFVHPSAIFVLSSMSQPHLGENVLHVGVTSQDQQARLAVLIGHDLALNAVELRLRYSPSSALQGRFDACRQDFARIWGFPPHL